MIADRKSIKPDAKDLSFVTIKIVDANGVMVPDANNHVQLNITDNGSIIGVDNGSETSMESFKAHERNAFNGLALVVVQSKEKPGNIIVTASSPGLESARLQITVK